MSDIPAGDGKISNLYLQCRVLQHSFSNMFKETVSQDFLLLVFFMNQFPQAPEYTIRAILNFFKNSRRYSQLKVDHRYQRHRWQIWVSTTLVANLPPVSMTPAANFATSFTSVVDPGGKQWD